jgi:SAM-dependent methyltransferase
MGMLLDPQGPPGYDWNPRRLVVQHMDALDLAYEDETFDGIFSSGSIEHFGSLENIHRSVVEMYRVLKPGGICALATEFKLKGPAGMPGTHLFTEDELKSVIFDGLDWTPASPLELSVSDATATAPIDFGALVASMPKPASQSLRRRVGGKIGGGQVMTEGPESAPPLDTPFPHIVLRYGEYLWTSVHVALIKPGDG